MKTPLATAAALGIVVMAVTAGCSSPAPSARPELAAKIAQQLYDDFGSPGDTTWYAHIRTVEVVGDTLIVGTDVEDIHSIATEICSGASNYVFSNPADPSLKSLEVRSVTGLHLVRRDSVSDRC